MIYRGNDGTMRDGFPHRMGPDNFERLEAFLDGKTVVPLRDIFDDRFHLRDERDPLAFTTGLKIDSTLVGMRHDVDHNLDHAVKFARWEHERGWRSTYFLLHTAWYFDDSMFRSNVAELLALGHEVGIHTNAVAYARDAGDDPGHRRAAEMLDRALKNLRAVVYEHGEIVIGAAAHGDTRCDKYGVHNNDLWREQGGSYDLLDFGLLYEAYFLHKPNWYISDSGGRWLPAEPLEHVPGKQTSILLHPCHWDIDAVTT